MQAHASNLTHKVSGRWTTSISPTTLTKEITAYAASDFPLLFVLLLLTTSPDCIVLETPLAFAMPNNQLQVSLHILNRFFMVLLQRQIDASPVIGVAYFWFQHRTNDCLGRCVVVALLVALVEVQQRLS